jgi:hypothetical protein
MAYRIAHLATVVNYGCKIFMEWMTDITGVLKNLTLENQKPKPLTYEQVYVI